MKKISITCMALVTCLALSGASHASIIGVLNFGGDLDTSPTAGDLDTATGVTFMSPTIISSSGTFAAGGVTTATAVSFTDFTFAPFAGPISLWSAGAYSFDLTTVNIVTQNPNLLVITGTGLVSSTLMGEDDTVGLFVFTGNGFSGDFSFSSTTAAVPEPTGILIWGGLAMAVTTIRRRRS